MKTDEVFSLKVCSGGWPLKLLYIKCVLNIVSGVHRAELQSTFRNCPGDRDIWDSGGSCLCEVNWHRLYLCICC